MRSLISTGSWRVTLRCVGVVASLLAANVANALAIGELRLQSHLGEPLHATVALGHLGGLSAHELIVAQAPDSDYHSFGLNPPEFGGNVKFEVLVDRNGAASVQITTDHAVSEPLLDVVLHVRWPNGHAVKQFSLLLDPPVSQ